MPPKAGLTLSYWLLTNITFTKHIVAWSLFEVAVLKISDGFILFTVTGEKAYDRFKYESGGHRWQRVPPTEHNGRYHTSTITIAVFRDVKAQTVTIRPEDITWFACRGSGNGGQNRNKRDTAVTVVHKPTGMRIRCETERSQHQNREIAIQRLQNEINSKAYSLHKETSDSLRKDLVGSGQRGDKIRTIRIRDDVVTNHLNDKKMSYHEYVKGALAKLF